MNVSAVIVTRGDVHLYEVLASIPGEWEIIVWDNSAGGQVTRRGPGFVDESDGIIHRDTEMVVLDTAGDLAVYGRYAAIEHASHDLIYVQDDDCVVSDPRKIARVWENIRLLQAAEHNVRNWHVVCNMPERFRHEFYADHALVGFGAVFHRDAPEKAFQRWGAATFHRDGAIVNEGTFAEQGRWSPLFLRACDIVFTGLTPRVLVDVPYEDLSWASTPERMWKQPTHQAERARMLDLVRQVLDAA